MNLNKVIIAGRLTRDPEGKALPSGMTVTSFSVATSRSYTNRDGARQEEVEYHNVVVFGKQADACAQFLKKGQIVGLSGRLQTRSWEKDGTKQYRTEVIADQVEFGPRSEGMTVHTEEAVKPPYPEYPPEEINPEDIPF